MNQNNNSQKNKVEFYAFWKGDRHSIFAEDLFKAKQQAIKDLNIPKSKHHSFAIVSKKSQENEDFRFC